MFNICIVTTPPSKIKQKLKVIQNIFIEGFRISDAQNMFFLVCEECITINCVFYQDESTY